MPKWSCCVERHPLSHLHWVFLSKMKGWGFGALASRSLPGYLPGFFHPYYLTSGNGLIVYGAQWVLGKGLDFLTDWGAPESFQLLIWFIFFLLKKRCYFHGFSVFAGPEVPLSQALPTAWRGFSSCRSSLGVISRRWWSCSLCRLPKFWSKQIPKKQIFSSLQLEYLQTVIWQKTNVLTRQSYVSSQSRREKQRVLRFETKPLILWGTVQYGSPDGLQRTQSRTWTLRLWTKSSGRFFRKSLTLFPSPLLSRNRHAQVFERFLLNLVDDSNSICRCIAWRSCVVWRWPNYDSCLDSPKHFPQTFHIFKSHV